MSKLTKSFALTAVLPFMLLTTADAAVVISKDLRGPSTWDSFTITTEPSTATPNFIGINQNATTGLGQSFTVTETGTLDAISFGVTRMYANRDGVVNVYQMFQPDGDTNPLAVPSRFRNGNSDWMSDAVLSIPFNTTAVNINNSGDGNNMYTFSLTGSDQLSVTSGEAYMVQIAGAGATGDQLMLWDKVDSGSYVAGTYGVPNGGTTTGLGGRDGLLAINITAVPEPSSLALLGLGGIVTIVRRRRRS